MAGRLIVALVMAWLLGLAGCTAQVRETEITPKEVPQGPAIGKSIVVLPVIISQPERESIMEAEAPMPDPEMYRAAIVSTLQQTGLFTAVKTTGDSDYLLASDVIGVRMLGTVYTVELLLIRYELTEVDTNRLLWSENIFSHFELSGEQALFGVQRQQAVAEGVTRNNMYQLSKKVGEVLSAEAQ